MSSRTTVLLAQMRSQPQLRNDKHIMRSFVIHLLEPTINDVCMVIYAAWESSTYMADFDLP